MIQARLRTGATLYIYLMWGVIRDYLFPPKMALSDSRKQEIDLKIKNDKIFVASKSYCPYCNKAKSVLKSLGESADIIELDELSDGSAIQDYLLEVTGQRTVPNIFIKGKHIGGSSDLDALQRNGKLASLL